MKGNRIAVIAAVVVVAAVVGFLAMRNYWPPKDGTEGAIGAANRYTSQQIGDQDVVLKDAQVQAFLQSDTFHQLATNPEFRTFVENMVSRNADARMAIADKLSRTADALQGFKLPENAVAALNADFFTKLPVAQAEALLGKGGLALLADGAFAQAVDNKAFRVAAARGVPQLLEAVRPMRNGDMLASRLGDFLHRYPDMLAVFANQDFGRWVQTENLQALADALNRPALQTDALASALADMRTRNFILDNSFAKLGDSRAFITALKDEGFQRILTSNLDLSRTLLPND